MKKTKLTNGMIIVLTMGVALILSACYLVWLPLGMVATGLAMIGGVVLVYEAEVSDEH